jgi:transposase-like protein
MRKPKAVIAAALRLYFDGSSLPKTGRALRSILGTGAHGTTVYRWIGKYVPMADDFLSNFPPTLSGVWHMDETSLRFRPSTPPTGERRRGEDWWQWDAVDRDTRFLVGTHVSRTRNWDDALAFVRACRDFAPRPTQIVTDNLSVYPALLSKTFYSRHRERRVRHVHSESGFRGNQPIERFHGTLEDRLTPMRGMKSPATSILRGFAIDYNFLRPHLGVGTTPAKAALIDLPFEDGWGDLAAWATVYRTLRQMRTRDRPTIG